MWIDIQAGPVVMALLWAVAAPLLGMATYGMGRVVEGLARSSDNTGRRSGIVLFGGCAFGLFVLAGVAMSMASKWLGVIFGV